MSGCQIRSMLAIRSASSQSSNHVGTGPSLCRARSASPSNSSRILPLMPHASHHLSSTSSDGGRAPCSVLAMTDLSNPSAAARASWESKPPSSRKRLSSAPRNAAGSAGLPHSAVSSASQ
jgi:hypothetical protein